ncbi:hypothetical protein UFOVP182_5 [uncultured Caudovirales phage]|uniref:Uncharacterized protein n=1 Tax=uncultured Caudovirales phage TaxID=2100421 RepID=A0A6J7WGA3_9CAUD|nr:hypothetical protein UFOVP182_5 [uncultured Caudovirales phage]
MACIITKGIALDCSNNTGGVEAIWLAPISAITAMTVNEVGGATAGDGTVTALTASTGAFKKFESLRNGISFEQPSTISLENGSTFYTHTLAFSIPKQDVAKRNKIYQLAAGQQKIVAIVKDMNGIYWVSGVTAPGSGDGGAAAFNNALQVTVSNAHTGKAKGDMNGYEVTLTAELPSIAYLVDYSVISTYLEDGTTTWPTV